MEGELLEEQSFLKHDKRCSPAADGNDLQLLSQKGRVENFSLVPFAS